MNFKFIDIISIKKAEIDNFLEEKPQNEIKAQLNLLNSHNLELLLDSHVISTLKIYFPHNRD